MSAVFIAGREISASQPPYIVAELSANHLGSIERALKLIEIAARAGADSIKLQTYRADTITIDHDGPEFALKGGLWNGRRLYELYDEAHTPWEWHAELFAAGARHGLTVFSSPFDPTAVEFLEKLGAPAYKIASFEIVDIPLIELCASTGKPLIISTGMASRQEIDDIPLIEQCASTGKPLIISTGMASREEIDEAVAAAHKHGSGNVILLHCTSGYPTPFSDADLRTIPKLAQTYGVPVGLSDHTAGLAAPVAAVALGAVMVEKHLTHRRSEGGPDAEFSLEPEEFAAMAQACRDAFAALGQVREGRRASEAASAVVRRSLYVVADMQAGQVFTPANLRSIRPGAGLPPKHLPEILGRRASHALKRGTPLTWDCVAP